MKSGGRLWGGQKNQKWQRSKNVEKQRVQVRQKSRRSEKEKGKGKRGTVIEVRRIIERKGEQYRGKGKVGSREGERHSKGGGMGFVHQSGLLQGKMGGESRQGGLQEVRKTTGKNWAIIGAAKKKRSGRRKEDLA